MKLGRENNKADGQGRENPTKDLWVRIRRGKDHLLLPWTKQTQPRDIGPIYYQPNDTKVTNKN